MIRDFAIAMLIAMSIALGGFSFTQSLAQTGTPYLINPDANFWTSARATSLTFSGDKGPSIIIYNDGRIEIGAGYKPSEAADAFIAALRPQLHALCGPR